MADNKMSEIIKASLDGIKEFTDMDTVIGRTIITPSGVTVIPVSRVTVGFASGGLDWSGKTVNNPVSFGGGGGTGVSITPVAFLTVDSEAHISLIRVSGGDEAVSRVAGLIEKAPDIIDKIKKTLT